MRSTIQEFLGRAALTCAVGMGVAIVASSFAFDAHAQGKKPPAKNGAAAVATDPPLATRPISLSFPGIGFGMPPDRLADAIDKILDDEYRPKYKDVQPGVAMKALDAQLAEEKAQFRRSRIDFGKLPTGLDSSPLRGEFSYNNKETMFQWVRNGENVYFFFIQDRLWKMIGEHRLYDKSPYGKDYTDAVAKFAGIYGVPGRILQPDGTNRFAVEVDWRDTANHLRLIQRSDSALALGLEDITTWQSLATLRVNKPTQDNGIDPAVAAAMRKDDAPPGPPDKTPPKKKK